MPRTIHANSTRDPLEPENGEKSEAARRQLSITFNTIGAVATCFFGLLVLLQGSTDLVAEGIVLLALSAALTGLVVALRRRLPVTTIAWIAGGVALAGLATLALLTADFATYLLMWMSVVPLAAILLDRPVAATIWAACGVGFVIVCYVAAHLSPQGPPPVYEPLAVIGLILVSLTFARISARLRNHILRRNARLRAQLSQAHQLQNMGEVAGAIAHDFNNVLTVIQSYASLLLDDLGEDEGSAEDLRQILAACGLAGELTAGLRTFAQNQPAAAEVVDLADLASHAEPLLQSLVGERIEVVVNVPPSLGPVRVDRRQLERVIANVALNARDAMPDGGRLELMGDIAYVSGVEVAMGLEEGPYGRLSLRDNGLGMEPDVASRVFEPFFTTKSRGQGTGLGLSTAYGTVRAAGGDLRLRSTPDRGTTFEILLPLVDRPPDMPRPTEGPVVTIEGSETILVVDDQPTLARSLKRLLETGGYRVLTAVSFEQAKQAFEQSGKDIDLLLTDVVMPDRNGPDLAAELKSTKPGLAVVFMSGYTGDSLPADVDETEHRFIEKPFSRSRLLEVVRRALDDVGS